MSLGQNYSPGFCFRQLPSVLPPSVMTWIGTKLAWTTTSASLYIHMFYIHVYVFFSSTQDDFNNSARLQLSVFSDRGCTPNAKEAFKTATVCCLVNDKSCQCRKTKIIISSFCYFQTFLAWYTPAGFVHPRNAFSTNFDSFFPPRTISFST